MLLPTSLLSMAMAAGIGYQSGKEALSKQAVERLVSVRAAKKNQVEWYFQELRDTFAIFGEDIAVISAMNMLKDGFARLGREKIAEPRRKQLESFYRNQFLPQLAKSAGAGGVLYENYFPRSDRTVEAQALFIAENPFKAEQRSKLVDHAVANPYTLAHFTYHSWFRDVQTKMKLYDLMLVDAETGAMVYSVMKEPDFATSLVDGPYANSNIGRLFRQVLSEHKKGYVKLIDFEFYAPSGNAPAMFIAAPVYSNFRLTGVLIGQISIDHLSLTMNGRKSWREDGLGETGIAYIAGQERALRNDHRVFIESPENFYLRLESAGAPKTTVEGIKQQNTTVLRLVAEVDGVQRALRGETGIATARNIIGVQTLQAFAPLRIQDLNWVISVQMEEGEILAPLERLKRTMMIAACGLALLSTLAAMALASRFLRPISALVGGIDQLRSGKADVQIRKTSDDEFGRLTDSFNSMSKAIKDRDDIIVAKNTAYEALLHRIFPDVVADRMKAGEEQIVETFSNVTVFYASVVNFVQSTEGMSGSDSMKLLNELIDTLDRLAGEMGMERVKTVGEHYIAACGLATPRLDHAQRAVAFADAAAEGIARFATEKGLKLLSRFSLASGTVHAGIVGSQHFVFDIWGLPLNLVRRLIHDADVNEIRICAETQRLLGASSDFRACEPVQSRTLGALVTFARPPRRAPVVRAMPAPKAAE